MASGSSSVQSGDAKQLAQQDPLRHAAQAWRAVPPHTRLAPPASAGRSARALNGCLGAARSRKARAATDRQDPIAAQRSGLRSSAGPDGGFRQCPRASTLGQEPPLHDGRFRVGFTPCSIRTRQPRCPSSSQRARRSSLQSMVLTSNVKAHERNASPSRVGVRMDIACGCGLPANSSHSRVGASSSGRIRRTDGRPCRGNSSRDKAWLYECDSAGMLGVCGYGERILPRTDGLR